jgi:hypothetical protein
MAICFHEPTLGELLEDSLTQSLMQADSVDAAALRAMLYRLALSIERRGDVRAGQASAASYVVSDQHRWSDHGLSISPRASGAKTIIRSKQIDIESSRQNTRTITAGITPPDYPIADIMSSTRSVVPWPHGQTIGATFNQNQG